MWWMKTENPWSNKSGAGAADQVGFIWLGGPAGLRCFNPRQPDAHWRNLGETAVTVLGPSPDGLALIGYALSELVEIDIDAGGNPLVRSLPPAPEAARCTYVDTDGGIWAATSTDLLYYMIRKDLRSLAGIEIPFQLVPDRCVDRLGIGAHVLLDAGRA